MKLKKSRIVSFGWSVLVVGSGWSVSLATPGMAQGRFDEGMNRQFERRHQGSEHSRFMLGVCVGEALAQQGISIPMPQPGSEGDSGGLDSSTQSALQSAIESCRSQLEGGTQPSPSPSGTATPGPAPTSTGSPNNPDPTPTSTGTGGVSTGGSTDSGTNPTSSPGSAS